MSWLVGIYRRGWNWLRWYSKLPVAIPRHQRKGCVTCAQMNTPSTGIPGLGHHHQVEATSHPHINTGKTTAKRFNLGYYKYHLVYHSCLGWHLNHHHYFISLRFSGDYPQSPHLTHMICHVSCI